MCRWFSRKIKTEPALWTKALESLRLGVENHRLIINPGSVGQPRDGNPSASYMLYNSDDQIMYHYRINYDITITQGKMIEYKLPLSLVSRLDYGY